MLKSDGVSFNILVLQKLIQYSGLGFIGIRGQGLLILRFFKTSSKSPSYI